MSNESLRSRILAQACVVSGEPFPAHRLASLLGFSKARISEMMREMTTEGELEHVEAGVYRRRSTARSILSRRWVEGAFDPGHFMGGEWSRA